MTPVATPGQSALMKTAQLGTTCKQSWAPTAESRPSWTAFRLVLACDLATPAIMIIVHR